jgi:hypothetical protein
MNKVYSIVGTSRKNGVLKVRFANGSLQAREKALLKDGQTDIVLVQLSEPMSKNDAIKAIINTPAFSGDDQYQVLSSTIIEDDVKIGSEVVVNELEEQPF